MNRVYQLTNTVHNTLIITKKGAMHQPDKNSYFPDRGFGLSPLRGGMSDQCLNKGVGELVCDVSGSDTLNLLPFFIDLVLLNSNMSQCTSPSTTNIYIYLINNNI